MPFFRLPSEQVTFPAACEQLGVAEALPPRTVAVAETNVAPAGKLTHDGRVS